MFRETRLQHQARALLPMTTDSLSPLVFLVLVFPLTSCAAEEQPPKQDEAVSPLPRAHAHNDYHHKRPLFDALAQGFCSVEADIFLRGEKFHVAHTRFGIRKDRTLEELYLKPLAERVRANGGHVYPDRSRFILLIDIKSDGNEAYPVLDKLLTRYGALFTAHLNGTARPGPVTAILSGGRPRRLIEEDATRYCSLDGRPGDLGDKAPAHLIPLVSDKWSNHFKWRGRGPFTDEERAKLEKLVTRCHSEGRLLRFWAIPDRVECWQALHGAGVDLINTDKLGELAHFLRSQK